MTRWREPIRPVRPSSPRRARTGGLAAGLLLLTWLPVAARATDPAAATRPADSLETLVATLAADDPAEREAAYRRLLQISPLDLPALRRVVESGQGRLPAQREALRDVVRHVFLVGDTPPAVNRQLSFLGVSAPAFNVEVSPSITGMTFAERLPGFPAYAALEEGDIVIGVAEEPAVALNSELVLRALREAVPPGSQIHFRVVRDGWVTDVPITLAPTPNWPVADGQQQQYRRLERAEAYWETQFEPAFAVKSS